MARIERDDLLVEGRGFSQGTLHNDAVAFGSRNYVWQQVPEALQGWSFTKTHGGVRAEIRVTAKREMTLSMATAPSQTGIDTSGWEAEPEHTFHYTDGGRTTMRVYRRRIDAGQTIELPQGNWTGGILLLPKHDATGVPTAR